MKPMKKSSTRHSSPLRFGLGAALLIVCGALVACDNKPASNKLAPRIDANLALKTRATGLASRLGEVLAKPWVRPFPIRGSMVTLHSNLVGWLRDVEQNPSEATWGDGHGLIYSCTEGFEKALNALEELSPIADELVLYESSFRSMIKQLDIDEASAFPLKNRYEQGWLKSKGDFLRMAAEGIDQIHNGAADTKFRAGLANLFELKGQGKALHEELLALTRIVHTLDKRFHDADPLVTDWVQRVLKEADRKRDLNVEALAVSWDRWQEARATLAKEWAALRSQVVADPKGTEARHTDLLKRVEAAEAQGLAPFPAASLRLGIPAPRS